MFPYNGLDPTLPQRRIDSRRAEADRARRARALRPASSLPRAVAPRRRLGRALIAVGRHLAADGHISPARSP